MVAAYLRIVPLTVTPFLDPQLIRELIYRNAAPEDRVEHLRIRAGPAGTDILAFIDTQDPQEAADILHRLIARTLGGDPLLRLWRIV